jgi:tetratricopeptide (TPR) repeat protein
MYNIGFALLAGAAVFLALFVPHILRPFEASMPALLCAVVVYLVLARRSFRQLEKIFTQGGAALTQVPPNFGQAVQVMERAYVLAPYQIGIRSQIDTQIGVIYFLQKEFNRALPYLKRSLLFGYWLGGAMLGVIYYKKKDHVQMRETFDVVTKRAKKQGLAWNLYAYLLVQIGDPQAAQQVLVLGQKHAKDDARVGEALLALQNGKKIRMKSYREQWYQFHLERPPMEMQSGMGNQRASRVARRGRW